MSDEPCFALLIEDAGESGCLGHLPELPGFSLRAATPEALESNVAQRIEEYVGWLIEHDLSGLTPLTARLAQRLAGRKGLGIRIEVAEHVKGSPVWESGNAAALFVADRRALDDEAVVAHLRFVRCVLAGIHEAVAPLSEQARARRPAPNRRSIDETLQHIGNCIWWYCSRIDDDLPVPEQIEGETNLKRIDRLFAAAERFLLGVPFAARARLHVPARFRTSDPQEMWNHRKVCRRQAEHVWTHLPGIKRGTCQASTDSR